MRLLAAELGEHGVKVNGINPDGVVRGSGHLRRRLGRQTRRGLRRGRGGPRQVLRPAHPAQARGAARERRQRRLRALHRRPATPPACTSRSTPASPPPSCDDASRRATPSLTVASPARPRGQQRAGDRRATRTGCSASSRCDPRSHRFPNGSVRTAGRAALEHSRLYGDMLVGLRKAIEPRPDLIERSAIDSWAVDYGLLDGSRIAGRQPVPLPRRPHRARRRDRCTRRSPIERALRAATACSSCRSTRCTSWRPTRPTTPARGDPSACCWSPTCSASG